MKLKAVRIMGLSGDGSVEELLGEFRLSDSGHVELASGRGFAMMSMLNGIQLGKGEFAEAVRLAEQYGMRSLTSPPDRATTITPNQGELFLVALLAHHSKPNAYVWAVPVNGEA